MNKVGNCQVYNSKEDRFWCPFLQRPMFHGGYTGKSGIEAMWTCRRNGWALRDVISCDIAGVKEKQQKAWSEYTEEKDAHNHHEQCQCSTCAKRAHIEMRRSST